MEKQNKQGCRGCKYLDEYKEVCTYGGEIRIVLHPGECYSYNQ